MSSCAHFPPGLEPTLGEISRIASRLQDDWWVVGSAAIALAGAAIEVPGVELLVSERDARELLSDWASPRAPGRGGPSEPPRSGAPSEGPRSGGPSGPPESSDAGERFRSVHGFHGGTVIPIEIMGKLEVDVGGQWVAVTPNTREAIDVAGGRVFIPDVADQLALLLMFRRPQDLVRAEMLMRLS
jgi:hypothetical protein